MKNNDLIKNIKKAILEEIQIKYNERSDKIEKEVDFFLLEIKDSLLRWTLLLQEGKITEEEFKLLLGVKKDLFRIKKLRELGISKISLGHFKNRVISIVINKVLQILF